MSLLARLALCLLAASAGSIAFAQEPAHEEVSVERVEVTLHATDRLGNPVFGLAAPDFRLFVDDRPVPISTVEWVSSSPDSPEPSSETTPGGREADAIGGPSGRLLVMLFQWEIAGLKSDGFIRMKRRALDLVDSLEPHDRVAVLSVGSRLWLRQDFTEDHERIRNAIRNVLRQEEGERAPGGELSIKAGLSVEAEEGATSIDKALLAIGLALRPLPGAKAILFFGWGTGRWDSFGRTGNYSMGKVTYSPEYAEARRALVEAQAPVFSLDISGGPHSLEESLERLSFETGGLYVPTYQFPDLAMSKVIRTIGSHYVLVFRKPEGQLGRHLIRIDTSRKNVVLLYRRYYEDRR